MGDAIAVTVIGNDRPGIVAGVTKALFDQGCNLEDVSSTILRGHFSMMMIIRSGDGRSANELEQALSPVAEELSLVVAVRPVDDADTSVHLPTHMVSVYGADKPGIVYGIAKALSEAGANVTDLTSRVIGSDSDPVYALMMEVSAGGVDLDRLVSEASASLGVDASVRPIEADLL